MRNKKKTEIVFIKIRKYFRYLVITAFVLAVYATLRNINKIYSSSSKVTETENRLAEVKKEQERLNEELEKVKSETYVETQIRDKLALAKEGDIVLVMPEEDVLKSLFPSKMKNDNQTDDLAWKKWLKLFNFI